MLDNLKNGQKEFNKINNQSYDSEPEEIEQNNEIEEKELATNIKRKESDDLIPHTKNGNISVKIIEDIEPKNESWKFLMNEQKKDEKYLQKIEKLQTNFKLVNP